jgi:hypothetical protein
MQQGGDLASLRSARRRVFAAIRTSHLVKCTNSALDTRISRDIVTNGATTINGREGDRQ